MSVVTEMTLAPLEKDIHITDPCSDAYQTLREKSLRLIKRMKGCKHIYWGAEVENPGKLRLFVDWDSMESCNKAKKGPVSNT
jgi:hypothetical protein